MATVVTIPNNSSDIIQNWVTTTLQNRQRREAEAQRQAQAEQAMRQREQERQDMLDKAMAAQFLALPPDQQAANLDKLSPGARRFILNTQGYTPHTPTVEEILKQKEARFAIEGYDDPSKLGPGGATAARYQVMTGASAPADVVEANVANDIYSRPADFAPQMQERQGIKDKRLLSADDARKGAEFQQEYSGLKLPESKSRIKLETSQTAENYASADEKSASAKAITAGALTVSQNANAIATAANNAIAKGATGDAALEGLPDPVKAFIKGIADGRLDITKVTSQRGGSREATAKMVEAYDPTWSTAVAPARAATYRDYYAGEIKHKAIDPLNTAIHHLDEAKNSAELLKNAPVQVWNRIRQYGLESLRGDPRYGRFEADTTLLSGEIGKLGKGGVPDKDELAKINKLMATVNSPDQIDTVLNEYVKLMAGRAIPITEGFVTRAGTAPPRGLILAPSSEEILRRRGFGEIADRIIGSGPAATTGPNTTVVPVKPTGKKGDPLGLY